VSSEMLKVGRALEHERVLTLMGTIEDENFSEAFRRWVEQVDFHQYQIFVETAKIVELLKKKDVSAKTKNEMLIVLKGLQATVKSITKVLSKYIQ